MSSSRKFLQVLYSTHFTYNLKYGIQRFLVGFMSGLQVLKTGVVDFVVIPFLSFFKKFQFTGKWCMHVDWLRTPKSVYSQYLERRWFIYFIFYLVSGRELMVSNVIYGTSNWYEFWLDHNVLSGGYRLSVPKILYTYVLICIDG